MTVQEFAALPDVEEALCELRDGELHRATRPKKAHADVQRNIRELLRQALGRRIRVEIEVAFIPNLHNLRVADVAVVSWERWRATPGDGYLAGSPELIVEVLSPSNTAQEMSDKRSLFLSTGCREFWVVNPRRQEVEVHYADGVSRYFGLADRIRVSFVPDVEVRVAAIFEDPSASPQSGETDPNHMP